MLTLDHLAAITKEQLLVENPAWCRFCRVLSTWAELSPPWSSPLESAELPLDDLPNYGAAALPASIACWFPLGQYFWKWFSLPQMWHFSWERVVAWCASKFLPCFFSADAALTSYKNPDKVSLLAVDKTKSPCWQWTILVDLFWSFEASCSTWLAVDLLLHQQVSNSASAQGVQA